MTVTSLLKDLGVEFTLTPDGKLKLRGTGSNEAKAAAMKYVQAHRAEILTALSQTGGPGECESCPASGYWDGRYSGLLCFHTAYYLHKSGKPSPCVEIRASCPRCQNG